MKITIIKTFFIISSILLLQSCSIEKRAFRPGYYIDWHAKKNLLNSQKLYESHFENQNDDTLDELITNDYVVQEINNNLNSFFINDSNSKGIILKKENLNLKTHSKSKKNENRINVNKSYFQKKIRNKKISKPTEKSNHLGLFSFILGIISLIMLLVALFNPLTYGTTPLPILFYLIEIVITLLAIIFGIITKQQFKKKKRIYNKRAQKLATIGIYFGSIGGFLFLGFIIAPIINYVLGEKTKNTKQEKKLIFNENQTQPQYTTSTVKNKKNTWALISFILGCLALIVSLLSIISSPTFAFFIPFLSIFGIITGIVSIKQIHKTKNYNKSSNTFSVLGLIFNLISFPIIIYSFSKLIVVQ